jgi:hypothetical protein
VFFDRSRRAGRYLEWKVRLFTLGAVLAVVGMAVDQVWMTWAAIVVLIAGMVLRFLPGGREREADPERDPPPET